MPGNMACAVAKVWTVTSRLAAHRQFGRAVDQAGEVCRTGPARGNHFGTRLGEIGGDGTADIAQAENSDRFHGPTMAQRCACAHAGQRPI
jgi:hypothetical protein